MSTTGSGGAPSLEVLATGPLALIEDLGRVGHMAVGVGRSGAADRGAYELGNRLLGNAPGSAAVEVTFGGLEVRAVGDLWLCLTGAVTPAQADSRAVPFAAPFRIRNGEVLRLQAPRSGLRTYLGVRGGVAVEKVLGSRSTDTMSGLGPAPLSVGDALPVGTDAGAWPDVDSAPVRPSTESRARLRVTPGPRHDWFAEPQQLAHLEWTVSGHSDRKGVRLTGGSLARAAGYADAELPSEGMIRGAIQVPPNGEPVIFLNDHPVTGGYPVIGVLREPDVDLAAQLTPGQQLTLVWQHAVI